MQKTVKIAAAFLSLAAAGLGYAMGATGGEVQVYALCAALCGGGIYFTMLSPAVRGVQEALFRIFHKIWGVFAVPF